MNPVTSLQLVAAESGASDAGMSIMSVLKESSGMVLAVLILLVAASVVSWFLIVYKALTMSAVNRRNVAFVDVFWANSKLDDVFDEAEQAAGAPAADAFRMGFMELRRVIREDGRTDGARLMNVERALRRAAESSLQHQERYLTFLATVGSTAPFVGLFGTVWGIMVAFMRISAEGAAGIDVVAGPIAEALIATAVGLFAAIPAVMGYNLFASRLERLRTETEGFVADVVNVVERSFVD